MKSKMKQHEFDKVLNKPSPEGENPSYDYFDTFDENGIIVVGKNGKFGYISCKGERLTPLKYDKAMRIYWNVGKVCINGKWGLVNKRGEEITPLIYDEISGHQDPIVKLNGKYGVIDRKTGKPLTPIKYDQVEEWTQMFFSEEGRFGDRDLAKVQLDGKWGCIDIHGNEFIPLKYDEIEISQSENPHVAASLNGKWGFVDNNGTEICPFKYDDVTCFKEGRACVKKDGKYRFIDNKGILVIPAIYDDCYTKFYKKNDDDEPEFAPIWVEVNGKYGYIDINGKEIIAPMYEDAFPFGFFGAAVVLNGKVGFIDETGKEVIPFMYEPDFDKLYNYRFCGEEFVNVKLNGKWGVIDTNNNVAIPFLYDEFLDNQHAGWRYALRDGKKLSIDTKGIERIMQKNPVARTVENYLQNVMLNEAKECFESLFLRNSSYYVDNEEKYKEALSVFEINFKNFKSKSSRPSKNILRIYDGTGNRLFSTLYCVEDECSYVYFDWAEILDMEVRIEDGLTFSDAEVAAICVWEASDQRHDTEETINIYREFLHGRMKTLGENVDLEENIALD
jgi:hypothetical protein